MEKAFTPAAPEGYRWVFTPYIRLRDGRILWAKDCGRKVFRFLVAA